MVVYLVTNTVNGKRYVGQTMNSLSKRWKKHVWDSKRKDGVRTCYLANAIKKYGEESFIVSELDTCTSKESLDSLEKFYIKNLKTKAPLGYNLTDGGEGRLGSKPTKLTRKKLSRARVGIVFSAEQLVNMSKAQLGKIVPKTVRRKISKSMQGRKRSAEHCKNISLSKLGKNRTEETKKKVSEGLKKYFAEKRKNNGR